jgi:FixJ family two-component response regulator
MMGYDRLSLARPRVRRDERAGFGAGTPNLPDQRLPALPVYVIDDDAAVGESLRMFLLSEGREVRLFPSVRALGGELHDLQPGCILLDAHLGKEDGLKAALALRQLAPDWPIIVMTGSDRNSVADAARAIGAQAILEKPFDLDGLLEQLSRASL